MEGAYGACGYDGACDEDAVQIRTVRTFACVDAACEPSDTEETRACSRANGRPGRRARGTVITR